MPNCTNDHCLPSFSDNPFPWLDLQLAAREYLDFLRHSTLKQMQKYARTLFTDFLPSNMIREARLAWWGRIKARRFLQKNIQSMTIPKAVAILVAAGSEHYTPDRLSQTAKDFLDKHFPENRKTDILLVLTLAKNLWVNDAASQQYLETPTGLPLALYE